MSIQCKEVQEELRQRNIEYPDFSFFDNRGSVIKIMQWQPQGIIDFNIDDGFSCLDETYISKAESFLQEAKENKADLVITPEYSFPWVSVQKMIENSEWHPSNGKLFCLGMQGISFLNLKEFIAQNKQQEEICVIVEDENGLHDNYFCSCLLYIFKSANRIILIIQLKTTPASDLWGDKEALGLTLGTTIYLFRSKIHNYCLMAYICADVLNQEVERIKHNITYQECLVLHPQLNPKPMHETFDRMRHNYLDYDRQNTRIIGVNWAKNTRINVSDNEKITIQESFSACYFSNYKYREEDVRELMMRNKAKGIDLAVKEHTLIWYMPDNEHCMLYTIDHFTNYGLSNVTGKHKEPRGEKYYEYNKEQKKWESRTAKDICRIDWDWITELFNIEKCCNGNCAIVQLYDFFAILLMDREKNDLWIEGGKLQNVFNKGVEENIILTKLREKCEFVVNTLQTGKLPNKFKKLADGNFRWILDNRGNITTKDMSSYDIPYYVMFIDSAKDMVIEKCISRFANLKGKGACDRLIIYYTTRSGLECYEKIYDNYINNPNNVKVQNTINGD